MGKAAYCDGSISNAAHSSDSDLGSGTLKVIAKLSHRLKRLVIAAASERDNVARSGQSPNLPTS
jgi:hypothetical protein